MEGREDAECEAAFAEARRWLETSQMYTMYKSWLREGGK